MQRRLGVSSAATALICWLLVSFQRSNHHSVCAFTAFCTGSSLGATTLSQCRRRHGIRMASAADDDDGEGGERKTKMDKATKAMTAFTNKYLKVSETRLCTDKSVAAVVIKGLAEHKVSLGSPLCPCRFYEDKEAEAKDGYWNCPCVPMRERKECHCMLFLTDDSPFVGEETKIELEEVLELSGLVEEDDDV